MPVRQRQVRNRTQLPYPVPRKAGQTASPTRNRCQSLQDPCLAGDRAPDPTEFCKCLQGKKTSCWVPCFRTPMHESVGAFTAITLLTGRNRSLSPSMCPSKTTGDVQIDCGSWRFRLAVDVAAEEGPAFHPARLQDGEAPRSGVDDPILRPRHRADESLLQFDRLCVGSVCPHLPLAPDIRDRPFRPDILGPFRGLLVNHKIFPSGAASGYPMPKRSLSHAIRSTTASPGSLGPFRESVEQAELVQPQKEVSAAPERPRDLEDKVPDQIFRHLRAEQIARVHEWCLRCRRPGCREGSGTADRRRPLRRRRRGSLSETRFRHTCFGGWLSLQGAPETP